ncbi:MAG TPA: hypothetical protein PKY30_27215, partial [Myxococcota bacterium]|nr:hypothetical protein [Myxococcota bacterium]
MILVRSFYVSFWNMIQRCILIRYMALGALLGPLPALAIPADALDDATRLFFEQAEKEAEAQRWAQAAMYYRMVLNKDPSFLPASLGLGQALERSGDRDAALRLYRSLGDEADAVEALARLLGAGPLGIDLDVELLDERRPFAGGSGHRVAERPQRVALAVRLQPFRIGI